MEKESTQTNNEQTLSTNDSTEAVDKNVPYDRFSEVNTQKNDALKQVESLQAQLDKMNQANKTKQEEELAKQGEYKQLLDNTKKELEGFKTKAEQWDSYQTNRRTSLMEKLTDDSDKDIAEGLSLDKLEKYVDKVVVKNAPSTSQARAGSAKAGDFGGYGSYTEWATKDPKGYEEAKKTSTNTGITIGWSD
tara:strand:- start:472 stop:1044 length:573 start_codon:yes stop_codon:yes gene_type:complete